MANGYKQALQRFEDSIRAIERAAVLSSATATRMSELAREYDAAKHHLVQKLSYRHLAAEERGRLEVGLVITGLMEIAEQAMPDTYYASDSRVQAARKWLGYKRLDRDE